MAEEQTDTAQSQETVDEVVTEDKDDTSTESLLSSEKTSDKSDDKSDGGSEKSLLSDDEKTEKSEAPEKYDLKLPEDSGLEATHVEKVAEYAKKQGFSNEQAQALLERDSELLGKAEETFLARQEEITKDYNAKLLEAAKTDPEIGGDKLPEVAEKAKRFFKSVASEKMMAYLDNPTFGNDSEVIRLGYHCFEKFMAEGKLETGSAAVHQVEKPAEDIMYPSTAGKET